MGKIPVATAQLVGTFLEAIFYGQCLSSCTPLTKLTCSARHISGGMASVSSNTSPETDQELAYGLSPWNNGGYFYAHNDGTFGWSQVFHSSIFKLTKPIVSIFASILHELWQLSPLIWTLLFRRKSIMQTSTPTST